MSVQIPTNIQEALNQSKWRAAIGEEIQALEKNGTWEITKLLRGKSPVGTHFKIITHDPYLLTSQVMQVMNPVQD